MNRVKCIVLFVAVMIIAGVDVFAEDVLDLNWMAGQLRQNQETLRQYTWESKVSYEVDGQNRRTDLYKIHYDGSGSLVKMQIGGEAVKGKVRRPNGKKLSKKEREAAYDFIVEVRNQLDSYLNPLFAEKAVATSVASVNENTIRLNSHGVIKTNDSVEITLALGSKNPVTLKVQTEIEGSSVTLEVEFGAIEFGPNHPKRSVTSAGWQDFKLRILTENSNYSK